MRLQAVSFLVRTTKILSQGTRFGYINFKSFSPRQVILFPQIKTILICFLGKTLHCHTTSLQPGVWMGNREFLGKSDEIPTGSLSMDYHPIQGAVIILLVASCYMKTRISLGWVGQLAPVHT